ncbi:MAG: DUF5522 domain-containing protein [Acidimicrobiales bacterium]
MTDRRRAPVQRSLFEPHLERLPADAPHRRAILDAHRAAIEVRQPGYLDPVTGLVVITAAEHVRRGHCCANDCRHCPYR